jgi:hypothetical protein
MHWPIGRERDTDGLMGSGRGAVEVLFGGPTNRLHTLPLIAVV